MPVKLSHADRPLTRGSGSLTLATDGTVTSTAFDERRITRVTFRMDGVQTAQAQRRRGHCHAQRHLGARCRADQPRWLERDAGHGPWLHPL